MYLHHLYTTYTAVVTPVMCTHLCNYGRIHQENYLAPVFIVMHPITNVKRYKPYFDLKFKNKQKKCTCHLLHYSQFIFLFHASY